MTNERNKSSGRPTARDVPFVRGAGMDSEPTPRGVRPAQLPRDPTYEAELAQVELAVLRDPSPREDPSTKPGGRLAQQSTLKPPPDSVTPESPMTRLAADAPTRSPQPPSSGRSVASGTLLSVGGVDPRGKTERTLETPRMFISQHQGSEAYFKPGKIPAVTVHQTIETETVKLSDSIDPRRAKTIPRLDRAALLQLSEMEPIPESEAPYVSQPRSSLDVSSAQSPRWNQEAWDAAADEEELRSAHDGQIHASLSPFREQEPQSFSLDGAPTRAEPLAARRSDVPDAPPSAIPDTSTVPTQRDLPVHRIVSLVPPAPAPEAAPTSAPHASEGAMASEGPVATSASIAVEEPTRRPAWINYAAFVAALLFAVVIGLFLTREPERVVAPAAPPLDTKPAAFDLIPPPPPLEPAPPPVAATSPSPTIATTTPALPRHQSSGAPAAAAPAVAPARAPTALPPRKPHAASPADDKSSSPAPKPSPRETIF